MIIIAAMLVAAVFMYIEQDQYKDYIANDATQYLEGADSIRSRREYTTNILYYDEHYDGGRLPAPQTVWPPGLSMSIAALSVFGISLEKSGRLISMTSYILAIAMTALAVWYLTTSVSAMLAATSWHLSLANLSVYATGIGTDMIFAAITTGTILFFVMRLRFDAVRDPHSPLSFATLAGISLLTGISFIFRYAGVCLIAWAMLLIGLELARRLHSRAEPRTSLLAKAAGAASPAIIIFTTLTVRNYTITGGIRGGNNIEYTGSIVDLSLQAARSSVTLLTGVDRTNFFIQPGAVTLIGLLALAAFAVITIFAIYHFGRLYATAGRANWYRTACSLTVLLVGVYVGCMIAIASGTYIGFGERHIVPIAPAVIILGTALWPYGRGILLACAAAILVTQTTAGILFDDDRPLPDRSMYVPLAEWVANHVPANEPIMAIGDSQRIGYFSGRPTLAVPSHEFTASKWNSADVTSVAERYGAKYVVVNYDDDLTHYGDLASSLGGGFLPPWLQRVQSFNQVKVFRIGPY